MMSPSSVMASAPLTQENLNEQLVMAALWMKTSAEYKALCYQAYNTAARQIEEAVAEKRTYDRPLAIIVDCDETVLNNVVFEAGLIGTEKDYTHETWNDWCEKAESTAIPGALECLKSAASLDVEVFYIGNRQKGDGIKHTIQNLRKCGFPYADEEHVLQPMDTGDKKMRFEKVMEKYEVVVFIGDNIADFPLGLYHRSMKEREAVTEVNRKQFGTKFILLPNPMYGSWEGALNKEYYKLSPQEKDEIRKMFLK